MLVEDQIMPIKMLLLTDTSEAWDAFVWRCLFQPACHHYQTYFNSFQFSNWYLQEQI